MKSSVMASNGGSSSFQVAHIGNSIQYYNDCPRLLERMLRASNDDPNTSQIHQNSCLRGGATLPSLWVDGNGMRTKFSSRPESKLPGQDEYDIGAPTVRDLLLRTNEKDDGKDGYWGFIVMNDHTQCVRHKDESIAALETLYLPAIAEGMKQAAIPSTTTVTRTSSTVTSTIIFVQTAAYKSPVKNSSDLGSFDDFTNTLMGVYEDYVVTVKKFNRDIQQKQQQKLNIDVIVAPLGEAYRKIRQENFEMWSNLLYANDDFHPSPHGTLLEACLLYCIISGGMKFELFEDSEGRRVFPMGCWWETARYMQPTKYPDGQPQDPLPLPSREEAMYLNNVAHRMYKLSQKQ